eukprot:TRINITY_DN517_c0_g1_i1.p1 TRINITY_DN517_c0_g1~~TRINITY_DN517_c0_g1_i1.p1  ORF type:complete len:399 (+),score=101.02 TRINITY_DN517_c0_g1_i1:30-1226(+)
MPNLFIKQANDNNSIVTIKNVSNLLKTVVFGIDSFSSTSNTSDVASNIPTSTILSINKDDMNDNRLFRQSIDNIKFDNPKYKNLQPFGFNQDSLTFIGGVHLMDKIELDDFLSSLTLSKVDIPKDDFHQILFDESKLIFSTIADLPLKQVIPNIYDETKKKTQINIPRLHPKIVGIIDDDFEAIENFCVDINESSCDIDNEILLELLQEIELRKKQGDFYGFGIFTLMEPHSIVVCELLRILLGEGSEFMSGGPQGIDTPLFSVLAFFPEINSIKTHLMNSRDNQILGITVQFNNKDNNFNHNQLLNILEYFSENLTESKLISAKNQLKTKWLEPLTQSQIFLMSNMQDRYFNTNWSSTDELIQNIDSIELNDVKMLLKLICSKNIVLLGKQTVNCNN